MPDNDFAASKGGSPGVAPEAKARSLARSTAARFQTERGSQLQRLQLQWSQSAACVDTEILHGAGFYEPSSGLLGSHASRRGRDKRGFRRSAAFPRNLCSYILRQY